MNWLQTNSGFGFDLDNPDPNLVRIDDIAHGLANLCRFGGQCKYFYSVAQHCVLGAQAILDDTESAIAALCFLLHDATEAYVVDVPRPVKRILGENYRQLEAKVHQAILEHFNIREAYEENLDTVHVYDARMLETERLQVMQHKLAWVEIAEPLKIEIVPKSPEIIRSLYHNLFFDLLKKARIL